ncbi:2-oxoglutarate and Fe(II)-dependent oxygenase superfamily protein, partial [Prunus dulcis]
SSLSRAKTGRRLPELAGAASGHHRPRDRWRWNRRRVPYLSRPIPRPTTTCAGWKLRKNDGNSPKLTETSRPPIFLLRPPFPSAQAPEARQNHRRDLQEVQLARTSSCRSAQASTTGPLLASAPPRSVGFCRKVLEIFENSIPDFLTREFLHEPQWLPKKTNTKSQPVNQSHPNRNHLKRNP